MACLRVSSLWLHSVKSSCGSLCSSNVRLSYGLNRLPSMFLVLTATTVDQKNLNEKGSELFWWLLSQCFLDLWQSCQLRPSTLEGQTHCTTPQTHHWYFFQFDLQDCEESSSPQVVLVFLNGNACRKPHAALYWNNQIQRGFRLSIL